MSAQWKLQKLALKVNFPIHWNNLTFMLYEPVYYSSGGKNMVISRNEEGELDFFFHFGNITSYDSQDDLVLLSLWHASTAGGGHAEDLRHESIDSRFSSWSMSALGSVDYKVSQIMNVYKTYYSWSNIFIYIDSPRDRTILCRN